MMGLQLDAHLAFGKAIEAYSLNFRQGLHASLSSEKVRKTVECIRVESVPVVGYSRAH